jgi:hypothetical protein
LPDCECIVGISEPPSSETVRWKRIYEKKRGDSA